MDFIEFRLIDIVDIVVVAILMFRLYSVVKGTVAHNIFIGLFAFLLFWLAIKTLHMELLTSILNNFVNVGVLALIIVFQQEIRRFFLLLGSRYKISKKFSLNNLFLDGQTGYTADTLKSIVSACNALSASKTGALIVFSKGQDLIEYIESGISLKAQLSTELLRTIFEKNTPMHDGAVILKGDKVLSACSILPLSRSDMVPQQFGLRHRAALGITEATDAVAIVVSEETGTITLFKESDFLIVQTQNDFILNLEEYLID